MNLIARFKRQINAMVSKPKCNTCYYWIPIRHRKDTAKYCNNKNSKHYDCFISSFDSKRMRCKYHMVY